MASKSEKISIQQVDLTTNSNTQIPLDGISLDEIRYELVNGVIVLSTESGPILQFEGWNPSVEMEIPSLLLENGDVLSSADLLANFDALSIDGVAPAAGGGTGGGTGGGAGFSDYEEGSIGDGIGTEDLLGFTELEFAAASLFEEEGQAVIQNDIPEAGDAASTVDEDLLRDRMVNGSFEESSRFNHGRWGTFDETEGATNQISGWKVDGENGPIELQSGRTGGMSAADGNNKLELDSHRDFGYEHSNSHVYQDVATTAGETFTLSFEYAARTRNFESNSFEVWWNGEKIATVTPESHRDWETVTFEVEANADGETSRLEFHGLGREETLGAYIDNVSLLPDFVSVDGTVDFDFGNDGAAISDPVSVSADIVDENADPLILTSDGTAVDVAVEGEDVVGRVGGEELFVFELDDDGNYSFTLKGEVDQIDEEDQITIGFEYIVTDGNGDSADGVIEITVDAANNNQIVGDDRDNNLMGLGDEDNIFAYGGDDILFGGEGDDTIDGGEGADTFAYNSVDDGHDTIMDLNADEDNIDLDSVFDALGIADAERDDMIDVTDGVLTIDDHADFSITFAFSDISSELLDLEILAAVSVSDGATS
jgi:uncharacterized protein DUF642/hemolysin type calcium-binding protein